MTKNIIIILLAIAAAVMLYFLLHDPKPLDSHNKDDYDRVVAQNETFKKKESVSVKHIDSLTVAGKQKDSTITVLKAEKKAKEKELDKYTISVNRLSKEVKELRKGDTSEFGRKCDSLAEQAQNFAYLYNQYQALTDTLSIQMEQQKGNYEAALKEQKALYNELKAAYDSLMDAYKILSDDYTKARKTIKRERLKTKIAALLGLIGGAAAVLK